MCYEPNRDMLICHSINMETGQECGGLIDYDDGFNSLICTKCGVKYNASNIAKILKENEIIVKAKERGNVKMKVGIIRGNKKTTLLDTTNMGTGIIRPTVDNITVPQTPVSTQQQETPSVKTVRVNINTELENAREKRNHKSNGAKVSVKRTPITMKKNNHNNGGYNKAKNNFNGSYNKSNGNIKVKITREDNRSTNKNEHVPGSKGAVAITAINIEDLANTTFKFSSYDAENGLVFVSGKTPRGIDVKVHFECDDAEKFMDDLGVEPKVIEKTIEKPVSVDNSELSTAVMELEQAKKDLLSQEEKNITLQNENEALAEALEAAKKTIDTIGDSSDKDEEIETLKSSLSACEESLKIQIEKCKDAEAAAMEAESLRVEIDRLKENATPDLSADLAAKDAELTEVIKSLESCAKHIESLEMNISNREAEIAELREQIEKAKEIKSVDAFTEEKEQIILIHSDMYDTDAFLSEEEKKNYNGPAHILVLKDTFEDYNEETKQEEMREDFLRDADGKLLCISHINDVPIDAIKFEQAGNTH